MRRCKSCTYGDLTIGPQSAGLAGTRRCGRYPTSIEMPDTCALLVPLGQNPCRRDLDYNHHRDVHSGPTKAQRERPGIANMPIRDNAENAKLHLSRTKGIDAGHGGEGAAGPWRGPGVHRSRGPLAVVSPQPLEITQRYRSFEHQTKGLCLIKDLAVRVQGLFRPIVSERGFVYSGELANRTCMARQEPFGCVLSVLLIVMEQVPEAST